MSFSVNDEIHQGRYREIRYRVIYPLERTEAPVVPKFLRPHQEDHPRGPKAKANTDGQRHCTYDGCEELLRPRQLSHCKRHAAQVRKREQRQRDLWRRTILSVSPFNREQTEELAASVCDRESFEQAVRDCRAEDARQREQAESEGAQVSYLIRVEGYDGPTWSGIDVSGPRLIVEAHLEDQTRGDGLRDRTPYRPRLTEKRKATSTTTKP
jgi:hypothetical protein